MRVLIVVDNAMTERAIRDALAHAPACEVIGALSGRASCDAAVFEPAPDLVLVDDMGAPDLALDRVVELHKLFESAKTVLLATRMDPLWLADATAAGLDAAVSKSLAPAGLAMLVHEVAAGTVLNFLTPRRAAATRPDTAPSLTGRELQILRLVTAGQSNGEIATDLFVTEQTVKFHLSNVYRKLGVSNRTEASHHAFVNGLVEFVPDPRPLRLERAA